VSASDDVKRELLQFLEYQRSSARSIVEGPGLWSFSDAETVSGAGLAGNGVIAGTCRA